jgi:putative flippase GtrA
MERQNPPSLFPGDRRSPVGQIIGALPGPVARLYRWSFTRYLLASIISLIVDVAIFLALESGGMAAGGASALGYGAGIAVHWLISSSFVFPGKTRGGYGRQVQQMAFAVTALMGLAITVVTVSIFTEAGSPPVVAKGAAVGISFFAVYLTRKYGVFR